ncbi:hypothetical protein MY04_5422 [Flammeovirga sp. MY04]|uniref:IPT/TIG domain-containing protein n=1 Tax=Flammeovirga yaeyamensis TaxID=367791 RepID=D0PR19_9BACT|nr:hypothetical protein [Flammeovirga sp. MY04]ACY02062.1 hypothetical protein [Flammeovirga yaeyamensis]ANQ52754.1 hypothetical protein MY04_5422 [Flammeovirga sp. MY04]
MNIVSKIHKISLGLAFLGMTIGMESCTTQKEYSQSNDIDYPQPKINDTDLQNPTVIGEPFVIVGENFKNAKVYLGEVPCANITVSASEDTIRATLPRIFDTSQLRVINAYKQEAASESEYEPVYPLTENVEYPTFITRGQVFAIKGTNVDLIYQVVIDGQTIEVDGSKGNPSQINVLAPSNLPDEVTIKVFTMNADSNVPDSNPISVEDAGEFFDPVEPVVLFDFEDGVNPYEPGDVTPENGLDSGNGISKGRGEHYLTVRKADGDGWTSWMGQLYYGDPIDLVTFTDPHLTFQINSESSQGYFQLELGQNGNSNGADFKASNTGNDGDNYVFRATNNEWQWVTVSLKELELADWGGGLAAVDIKGTLDFVKLSFKQGNGGNPYILNLDNVMITDGPIIVAKELEDFETATYKWDDAGAGVTHSIDGGSMNAHVGDHYIHAHLDGASSWTWTGALEMDNSNNIDLSAVTDPHLSFWVNTGSAKGNLQFEIFQNETKFGGNIDTENYSVQTNGEWQLYTFRLSTMAWSNWGGDAEKPDFGGSLDYIKFGFSTGNIDGERYETNVDGILISDGPMF